MGLPPGIQQYWWVLWASPKAFLKEPIVFGSHKDVHSLGGAKPWVADPGPRGKNQVAFQWAALDNQMTLPILDQAGMAGGLLPERVWQPQWGLLCQQLTGCQRQEFSRIQKHLPGFLQTEVFKSKIFTAAQIASEILMKKNVE